MDETAQKVAELREKFFKKLADEGPPDSKEFHALDIVKVKTMDDWLRRFLEHHEFNMEESLKMLWETCEWRRNFGTNDISVDNVKREYLEDGVCFSYGEDKDGKKLFIIKSKLHSKNARNFEELKRCIVYWFERLEREQHGDQISLFFDMIDAGLSNLDMELTKYLIGLFKNYYPNYLNYIIILEMPWVLNAAFNIIKSWLPAKAIPKIKFVKKSTLKEFVPPSVALKCWGGQNDYVFKFVPEVTNCFNGLNNRKVHFSGNSPLTEQQPSKFPNEESNIFNVDQDILTFKKNENEFMGTFTVTNCQEKMFLAYKIKTTSPDKFKVRPNTGVISPGEKVLITIVLQQGYASQSLLPNDKFLIMGLSVKDGEMPAEELVKYWKVNQPSAITQKLLCRDGSDSLEGLKSSMVRSSGGSNDYSINSLFSKISHLENQNKKLQNDLSSLKKLLILFLLLTSILLSWIAYNISKNSANFLGDQSCMAKNIPILSSAESVLGDIESSP